MQTTFQKIHKKQIVTNRKKALKYARIIYGGDLASTGVANLKAHVE